MAQAMKIAIVDDEKDMRQSISQWLALSGYDTETFGSAEDALKVLQTSVDRNPAVDRTHLHLAATLAELGRIDDAAWAIDEALAISPNMSLTRERSESLYRDEADIDLYINALRKAGLPE